MTTTTSITTPVAPTVNTLRDIEPNSLIAIRNVARESLENDDFVISPQLLGDADRLTNIDIGLVNHLNTSVTAETREQILLTIANRTDNGPQLFNAIVRGIDPSLAENIFQVLQFPISDVTDLFPMLGTISLGFALGFTSTTAITQNILSSLPDIVSNESIEDVINRSEAIAERRTNEQSKADEEAKQNSDESEEKGKAERARILSAHRRRIFAGMTTAASIGAAAYFFVPQLMSNLRNYRNILEIFTPSNVLPDDSPARQIINPMLRRGERRSEVSWSTIFKTIIDKLFKEGK